MLKPLSVLKVESPLVTEQELGDYRISSEIKTQLNTLLGEFGYGFDTYTSYATTDKAKDDKPANYAVIPNQYYLYAVKLHSLATELFKYFTLYESVRPFAKELLGTHSEVEENIIANEQLKSFFQSEEDIKLFSAFIDKTNSDGRLGSKRLINDQGVPRGAKDCFSSVILKEINLPDNSSSIFGRLVFDLCSNPSIYEELVLSHSSCAAQSTPNSTLKTSKIAKVDIHLSKPFILLAGISGTGKTRFVREQAERQEGGDSRDNYCLVSVRPDWHEPSDLLGYVSRLGTQPNYIATDVLRFMVSAWKEIISDIVFEEEVPVEWRGKQLENIRPFWLCLDEMNLAPVEQYFADYLSVLETRSWTAKGKISDPNKSYEYDCDPLVSATLLSSLDSQTCPEQDKRPTEILAQDLGLNLEDELDSAIWRYFLRYGISIPFNLIVAGTVNMDETTHGFSRKVIDRALTFDFGEFFPNDFQQFFQQSHTNLTLSYPTSSQATMDALPSIDSDGSKTIAFLNKINQLLKQTPFELAYRALNELLLSVITHAPQSELELKAVWDDYLMCKVLPRIEGDADKLATKGEQSTLLKSLLTALESEFADFWLSENSRPDLFRSFNNQEGADSTLTIECRSKRKLKWMQERLEQSGYCAFWP